MTSRMGSRATTRQRTATTAGAIALVACGCRTPDPPMCGPTQALDPTRGECIPSCGTPEAPNFPTCFERDGGRIVESGPASDTGATDVLASDVREDSGGVLDASAEGSVDAEPCGPGGEWVAGECDLRVPRAIAPTSTARVTSRRPRLKWVLPPGITGAHVEVCADRACARLLAEGTATDEWTPPTELPTGVAFWRLRGVVGGRRSVRTSPTWWMWIPARSATGGVQTSWGSVPDVNGDGLGDVIACESEREPTCDGGLCSLARCSVFLSRFGSGVNLSRPHQVILARSPRALLGFSSAVADVNGDGFADVMLNEFDFEGEQSGTTRVFLGSASGTLTEAFSMRGRTPDSMLGFSAAGVGDVNGDGYGDVAVAAIGDAPMGLTLAGEVRIYWGGADGVRADRFQAIFRSEPRRLFGMGLHSAGDFNADGFADVLISQLGTAESPPVPTRTFAYAGGSSGLVSTPVRVWTDRENSPEFGVGGGAGDFNGDGFADVWVGNHLIKGDARGLSTVSIFYGSTSGPSAIADAEIRGDATTRYEFGWGIGGLTVDIDRDGFDDLVLSARREEMSTWSYPLHWFRGSARSLSTSFTVLLGVVDGFRDESFYVAAIGDANGDGLIDYALSRRPVEQRDHDLVVVHGGATTIDPLVRGRRAPEMGAIWSRIIGSR